jgi:hypothetical protein
MFKTMNVLFLLTLIQFWWIAIWGLAYIFIDAFAGESKIKEISIYVFMILFTMLVFHHNPQMIERL